MQRVRGAAGRGLAASGGGTDAKKAGERARSEIRARCNVRVLWAIFGCVLCFVGLCFGVIRKNMDVF